MRTRRRHHPLPTLGRLAGGRQAARRHRRPRAALRSDGHLLHCSKGRGAAGHAVASQHAARAERGARGARLAPDAVHRRQVAAAVAVPRTRRLALQAARDAARAAEDLRRPQIGLRGAGRDGRVWPQPRARAARLGSARACDRDAGARRGGAELLARVRGHAVPSRHVRARARLRLRAARFRREREECAHSPRLRRHEQPLAEQPTGWKQPTCQ
mmetsp:Transcript_10677/g.20657  ORF Transcript_10677/g.20657 Transcript_10677/m.20657 type:complete len:214 (+) Transcript_10677:1069-1710(+)